MLRHDQRCGKAEDHLAAADRAFAAGDYDAGSILLYESVECALKTLAEASGISVDSRADIREFADLLDRQYGSEDWHARKLRLATVFRDNAAHHFAPPDDIELSWPSVRDFARTLVGYQPESV